MSFLWRVEYLSGGSAPTRYFGRTRQECLEKYGGPFLFGAKPCIADAMFAPVVTRFITYDVPLDEACVAYCDAIMALPAMQEWVKAAEEEPDEIDELDAEF